MLRVHPAEICFKPWLVASKVMTITGSANQLPGVGRSGSVLAADVGRRVALRLPSKQDLRSNRDLAVDRLRALCLVSMTVAHLALAADHASVVDAVVHLPVWVSGAAGFVFLSGTSIGLFWVARGGPSVENRMWALNRGVFLAGLAVALNTIGVAWFRLIGPPSWYPEVEPTVSALVSARWSLLFADVMWMYAAFLVVVAVLGRLLMNHPMKALAGSVVLYAASQFGLAFGPTSVPGGHPTWNLPAWQFLFVTGLLAGTRWNDIRKVLDDNQRFVWWAACAAVGVIVTLRIGFNFAERGIDPIGLVGQRDALETVWLGKNSLAPARLGLVLGVGPAAYLLCRHRSPLDWILIPAGGRSLRIYAVSTVAAYLWVATGVNRWPVLNAEIAIIVATVVILTVGRLPALGRGRAWSF